MDASATKMDEQALVGRLLAGDRVAQAELFRRLRPYLLRHAVNAIGNRALADEIVQDAWIRAMTSIDSFQGRSSFCTWVTSVLLNEARSHRRRETRSLPMSALGPRELEPEQIQGRTEETPESILLTKEAAGRVEQALGTLSRTQRSVVVLRDFQGASPAEACEVLSITDLAQRVHLSRARATLRRALEDDGRLCA
jgi:RNA polymerase sigma-70 factor, ECF subfamily